VRASLNVTGAECVEPVNGAALLFNGELRSLVDAAGPRMPGASFSVVDSYKIIKDLLDHPRKHGTISDACIDRLQYWSCGSLAQLATWMHFDV
jgi:hypothetical protein